MTRDELRQRMPTVAAVVDEYRPFMGKGAKVVYASENGYVLDRREKDGEANAFRVPPNYCPSRPVPGKDRNARP